MANRNQELNTGIITATSQRIQFRIKKHSYISLVAFSPKQFINLWPWWPFEDYKLFVLLNVFQLVLAFVGIFRLCITESNIKVSRLCFIIAFYRLDHLFFLFVPLLMLFILLLDQNSVARIPTVSIHHAFHQWFYTIIQRSCKSSLPFLPLEFKALVMWRSIFQSMHMLFIYLFVPILVSVWTHCLLFDSMASNYPLSLILACLVGALQTSFCVPSLFEYFFTSLHFLFVFVCLFFCRLISGFIAYFPWSTTGNSHCFARSFGFFQ